MKPNPSPEKRNALTTACLNSCKAVLARIKLARQAILTEARETLQVQDRLLRLALNEAEALAWESRFPHLVFPDLAAEKIRGVAAWNQHQRNVVARSQLMAA